MSLPLFGFDYFGKMVQKTKNLSWDTFSWENQCYFNFNFCLPLITANFPIFFLFSYSDHCWSSQKFYCISKQFDWHSKTNSSILIVLRRHTNFPRIILVKNTQQKWWHNRRIRYVFASFVVFFFFFLYNTIVKFNSGCACGYRQKSIFLHL